LIDLVDFFSWFMRYYGPPMLANAAPVLVKGARRVDFNIVFIDGRDLLGSNKTWEGLLVGITLAYIGGSVIGVVYRDPVAPVQALGAGLFALIGDIIGAFIKRRLGIKPGDPAIFLDQWDFALGSTLFYYLVGVKEVFQTPIYIPLMLITVFALHVLTNMGAYALGLKHTKL